MDLRIYNSKEELASSFSEFFAEYIDKDSKVHVALSGGSTPKIVFDELARKYKESIAWENVLLYWGDERCVPPDDSESNYKMTVDHLISKIELPEKNIYRVKGENDPAAEAISYGETLEMNLPKGEELPQFDLVILGMGEDGHTASIFPHEIQLWDSSKYCEVANHPETGQQRITITGKIINNAKLVVFLVTGTGKAHKVEEIINKSGAFREYPASLVSPNSGNLIWFVDEAAADKLEG